MVESSRTVPLGVSEELLLVVRLCVEAVLVADGRVLLVNGCHSFLMALAVGLGR